MAASLHKLKYLHVRPWSCVITDGHLRESLPEVTHVAIHILAGNAQEALDLASVHHMSLYLTPLHIGTFHEFDVEVDLVVRSGSAMQWLRLHVPSSVHANIDMQKTDLSYHVSEEYIDVLRQRRLCEAKHGTCPDSLPTQSLPVVFPEPSG